MQRTDVMIIGLGTVGLGALHYLFLEPGISKVVTADIGEDGLGKTHLALNVANQLGCFPEVEFRQMDVFGSIEKNAEIIKEVNPKVIISGISVLSPRAIRRALNAPELYAEIIEVCGAGLLFPMQLRGMYHLALAIKEANIDTFVINSSYPDGVGPALRTQGLAPTVGLGNIDILAPSIRREVADREHVKPRDVVMFLVAHHSSFMWLVAGRPEPDKFCPYFLKAFVDSKDITDKYDTNKLLKESVAPHVQLGLGAPEYPMVSASGAKNALALMLDRKVLTHVPSPNGMPGGYPVRLGAEGAKVVLPEGITEKEAIEVNLEGQRRDGIEEIRDDGTIVLMDRAADELKKVFDLRLKSFKVKEIDDVANELWVRVQEVGKRRD